ncbi:glycosyltransferase family 2 protein [uncultured Pseudokineococcus sp.]|uniref:glycosyltransferase family 2 protein n=1 Tax=uncultured Pseudokineococcus sp. TaxID=1642928 RepID=UPI0026240E50|nr:glycosyltransferase [uncultured Pseudokineococcus sp.]
MAEVAILIAAHDEEDCIGPTLAAATAQTHPLAAVVVMADNCSDRTVEIARSFPGVTVIETVGNRHKKAGALNEAWQLLRGRVDHVACLDADTIIPPESVAQWVAQMDAESATAGISARFTMQPAPGNTRWGNLLARLQKAEFARWTDTALNRGGRTSVLAGTACMLRMSALEVLHAERCAEGVTSGPWSYASDVEDFELTYRLRRLGFETKVSFTVRAYTDAMTSLRALWAQRMKWQGGTVEDLLSIGVTRLTLRDWGQQALGLLAAAVRFGWVATTALYAVLGVLSFHWVWFVVPLLFVAGDVKQSLRVPHRDRTDVLLAALLVPQELFAWMRAAWFTRAWVECLVSRYVTGRKKDRWAAQYAAETAVAA